MKKVFVLTQFGSPHTWTQQFIDHLQHLEQYGWYWKIFTPNKLESKGNVEVIPMTTDQFNDLVEKKLGVRPNIFMTKLGVPSVHITDYCVAWGRIFEDYLQGCDFWGIPNWDEVYGRLDHFFPDSLLDQCDIFTDDTDIINGIFSLFRNIDKVNDLFKEIPLWQMKFAQSPCPKCLGEPAEHHQLYGTDEYDLTEVLRIPEIRSQFRYLYPAAFPLHSYDRLEQHMPNPKLQIGVDGSLWEFFNDIGSPDWIHAHKQIGREIPMFHFIRTKRWPL